MRPIFYPYRKYVDEFNWDNENCFVTL